LMMSLWDALRMNMMISYQELVRTFPYSSLAFLFSFWSFLSLLISLLFVYACISIIEVVA
ncbi:hypothetical protein ACFMPF_24940, partial [Citrobacter sp. S5]|uniref:hypothetical protein n=1 Tax=Citrobacter sp. S5 TaxID=3351561 RepID=UPI003D2E011B